MQKLIFLVNGDSESWAGIRARFFAVPINKLYRPIIYYKTEGKLQTTSNFIKKVIREKPQCLYILQPGYVNSIPGLLAKALFKTKIIIDIGDIAYEVAKLTGDRTFIALTITKIIEKLLWKLSDVIIVRGFYHKLYFDKLGYKNVHFIPDGIDTATTKPVENVKELRKQFGLENCFTIGVMGSINWSKKLQMCYGWEIIEAIKLLKDLQVKGVIIGDGNGIPILKEKAKEYKIYDKIVFTGRIRHEELPEYLNLIDVCISTQTNNIVGWLRTTGKLPIYLACNKYILTTKVGSAIRVLPEEMLIPYNGIKDIDYPGRLAQKIRNLYNNPNLLSVRKNGNQIAKEQFEYSKLAEKVADIIRFL